MLADAIGYGAAFLHQSLLEEMQLPAELLRDLIASRRERRDDGPAVTEHGVFEIAQTFRENFVDALALRRDREHRFACCGGEAIVQIGRKSARVVTASDTLRSKFSRNISDWTSNSRRAPCCAPSSRPEISEPAFERGDALGEKAADAVRVFGGARNDVVALFANLSLKGGEMFAQHSIGFVAMLHDARSDFVAAAQDELFEDGETVGDRRANAVAMHRKAFGEFAALHDDRPLEGVEVAPQAFH